MSNTKIVNDDYSSSSSVSKIKGAEAESASGDYFPRPVVASVASHRPYYDSDDSDDDVGDIGARNRLRVTQDSRWEEMFQRLIAYKEEHGHCLVPYRYPQDRRLGKWVSAQRTIRKGMSSQAVEATTVKQDRIHRLDVVGFQWTPSERSQVPWEHRYQELCSFVKKYGHGQVPIGWKENVQLANWVSMQRQEYKLLQKGLQSRLSEDRLRKLNDVGFIWEALRGGPRRQKSVREVVPMEPRASNTVSKAHRSKGGRRHHSDDSSGSQSEGESESSSQSERERPTKRHKSPTGSHRHRHHRRDRERESKHHKHGSGRKDGQAALRSAASGLMAMVTSPNSSQGAIPGEVAVAAPGQKAETQAYRLFEPSDAMPGQMAYPAMYPGLAVTGLGWGHVPMAAVGGIPTGIPLERLHMFGVPPHLAPTAHDPSVAPSLEGRPSDALPAGSLSRTKQPKIGSGVATEGQVEDKPPNQKASALSLSSRGSAVAPGAPTGSRQPMPMMPPGMELAAHPYLPREALTAPYFHGAGPIVALHPQFVMGHYPYGYPFGMGLYRAPPHFMPPGPQSDSAIRPQNQSDDDDEEEDDEEEEQGEPQRRGGKNM